MAKRLCKLNRRDITEHLGEIHRLVTQPKFVCQSCARSSANEVNLCKPIAIPPLDGQVKPDEEQLACGPFSETLSVSEKTLSEALKINKLSLKNTPLDTPVIDVNSDEKAELKRAKKAVKKQEKYNKKLAKMIKKQQKLFKKSQELESELEHLNVQVESALYIEPQFQVANHLH
ncbi:DUF3450 domain-containing protein [Vibrio artabrorum]|uniref:DUF3450 domain-containing protein n=1 Tax=Vibrio artabrorum TaxID=446374 RepID=A0ABT8CII1_9VIBR|nr:DUF3450 domain-containing protein [Vibrio artabrorum]MDN3700561.1 DUF3450 domain-containing protein [Vibrio artabrorum]